MEKLLEHKHLIIRAEIKNPFTSVEDITEWSKELVQKLDMKIMMGPYASKSFSNYYPSINKFFTCELCTLQLTHPL